MKAELAAARYMPGKETEAAMRVFILSLTTAAIIAGVAYVALSSVQESSGRAYTTGSARLDWQEQSNIYGREVPPPKGAGQP